MGLVPKGVRGKVGLGEVKLVLATAKVLAKAGRDIWDARNEEQQRWELGLGITERKGEVRRREWKGVPSGKARGRPKMAPEDLSVTYRLKLEGEDRMKARIIAGMTKAQAKETERDENRERTNTEKKKEKDEVELRRHGGEGLRGAARLTTREEDERQFRSTLRPRKQ